MIEEKAHILEGFKSRFLQFIEVFEILKKEKQILIKDKENLLLEIDIKNKKITELEKKVDVIKLATSMQSPTGDVHDAKIKINRLVREIDNCIDLLNK